MPSFYTDNDMFLENVVCFELHVYAHDSCGAQYKEAAGVHSYSFDFLNIDTIKSGLPITIHIFWGRGGVVQIHIKKFNLA